MPKSQISGVTKLTSQQPVLDNDVNRIPFTHDSRNSANTRIMLQKFKCNADKTCNPGREKFRNLCKRSAETG